MSEEQKPQEEILEETAEQEAVDDAQVEAESPAADELEAARAEATEAKDQVLRVQAEMQNVRRRAEQDVEKAHKFAVEKFANEMLTGVGEEVDKSAPKRWRAEAAAEKAEAFRKGRL